ncbi:hypothetical protein BC833DRAFT_562693 [Globomyces pollinis-pini]|nr:hypothetical protein BC833DRAFT_562693 [Globomyces pollinis-pini]
MHKANCKNTIGANKDIQFRLASDLGSIGSILENAESFCDDNEKTSPFSVHVCKECQSALVNAFDHCLINQGQDPNVMLNSVREIDEIGDGIIQSEMPYFDIVKDPTKNCSKKIFEKGREKVERDRWVLQQAKESNARLDITKKIPKVGLGVKTGKSFSGAIYKRMLNAKELEITKLRQQLFETSQKEKFESTNVQKLKVALNKSVNYYVFAEEWQKTECSRLQDDLLGNISELQKTIKTKEVEALESKKDAEKIKEQLRESFQEFIAMDETMARLRKEAHRGTDAVEARNVMLQKNLAKLTTDFEVTAKELRVASNKTRELEYELDQLVVELNAKGESLKKMSAMNVTLKTNLENTTFELRDMTKNHDQLLLLKSKVEADARAESSKNETIKAEFRKNLLKTTNELDALMSAKTDLEVFIKANKLEIDKLSKNVQVLVTEKEQLETVLDQTKKTGITEIALRDTKISDLTSKLQRETTILKATQEKKEQLMFQVTDLQNNLEVESSKAKKFLEELTTTRRTLEERTNSLQDQIDKLTIGKTNLANDKKELTEKIKNFRKDLREKEEELDETIKKFEEYQKESISEHNQLDRKLKLLAEDHKLLIKTHDSLKEMYTDSVKSNLALEKEKENLTKKWEDTTSELSTTKEHVVNLQAECANITREMNYWKREHGDLKELYEAEVKAHTGVVGAFEAYKEIAQETIEARDNDITRLTDCLQESELDGKALASKNADLENQLSDTEQRLADTIKKLLAETATRECLEKQLDENRSSYLSEKRMRSELERVHLHLKYGDSNRTMVAWNEWRTRDRKLADVAIGLTQESTRLRELVSLLPSKSEFGNENDFVWPTDLSGHRKRAKSAKKKEKE